MLADISWFACLRLRDQPIEVILEFNFFIRTHAPDLSDRPRPLHNSCFEKKPNTSPRASRPLRYENNSFSVSFDFATSASQRWRIACNLLCRGRTRQSRTARLNIDKQLLYGINAIYHTTLPSPRRQASDQNNRASLIGITSALSDVFS